MGTSCSVIKQKINKANKYNWRSHKEQMLGLDDDKSDPVIAREKKGRAYAIAKQNEALIQEELEREALGYCPQCGYGLTLEGFCQNHICEFNTRETMTLAQWYQRGQDYQLEKLKYFMVQDLTTAYCELMSVNS